MSGEDLWRFSALELHDLYTSRQLSPVEVTDAVLKRIETLNPCLGAYISVTDGLAQEHAQRAEVLIQEGLSNKTPALLGVPVSVKDLIPTKGIRTTMGSLLLQDWVPEFDSPVGERLRTSEAVFLGKTNTCEFGWKGDSGNRLIGPTHNPWRPDLTAGGSSGGAAAAVVAGLGPVAVGSDAAGSIRIPASFCGAFGFKPSFGLIPAYPISPLESLAHIGVLSTTVADAARTLRVLMGADPRDRFSINTHETKLQLPGTSAVRGLRVAWSADLGHAIVDPDVLQVTTASVLKLESLGCHVDAVVPGWEDPYPFLEPIWAASHAGRHLEDLEEVRAQLDPGRLLMVEQGMKLGAADLAQAHFEKGPFANAVLEFMQDYDLLITPTLPSTAFPVGLDRPSNGLRSDTSDGILSWTPFTYPFNITGQPAASVPAGFSESGLPVGLQIVGRWRQDSLVLAVASALEEATPWPRHVDLDPGTFSPSPIDLQG